MASLIPPSFFPATTPSIPTTTALAPGVPATTITSRPSLPPGFIRPTVTLVSLLPPVTLPTQTPSIPPPPGFEPNFDDSVTLAVPIIIISALTSVLALVVLSMRLYSTFKITRTASYDDGAIVLALALSLTYVGLVISIRDKARHGWDQPISAFTVKFFRVLAVEIIIGALAFLLSKVSILLLLLRLFSSSRTMRYLVYFGLLWATITSIIVMVTGGIFCAPRHDESNAGLTLIMRCAHENKWALVQGVLNMALNFFILLLPTPILYKMQMGQKRKIGVIAILMTGLIVCAASTIGLAYRAQTLEGPDLPWITGIAKILAIAEINLAITVACMPACASYLPLIFTKSETPMPSSHEMHSRESFHSSLHP